MNHFSNKNYFTMPNEIFSLGLDASEIAVYAYLRCLESRSTYQCWPSYLLIIARLFLYKECHKRRIASAVATQRRLRRRTPVPSEYVPVPAPHRCL